jgi:hypothetical protein
MMGRYLQFSLKFIATYFVVSLFYLPSFAPSVHAETDLPVLEGVWFTCEFATRTGPPDDQCKMFDDEGFSVEDGKITYLRNIASDEQACRGNKAGQCFAANTKEIKVSRRPVGIARIENNQLLVSYFGCTQKFDLKNEADYVTVVPVKEKCIWTRNRHFYVAPYHGKLNTP